VITNTRRLETNVSLSQALLQEQVDTTIGHPGDWQRHHAGELSLILAGAPVAYVEGAAHHIFADERVEMASCASLIPQLSHPLLTTDDRPFRRYYGESTWCSAVPSGKVFHGKKPQKT
jgi:hypothetical protein